MALGGESTGTFVLIEEGSAMAKSDWVDGADDKEEGTTRIYFWLRR
jgi:hypothetical protein